MNGIFGGGGGSGDAKKNTGSMWNLIHSDLITTYCKDLGEFRSGLVRETQSLKNLAFTSPNPNSDDQIQFQSQSQAKSRARPSQGNERTHKANNSPSNPDDGKEDDYSRRETPRHRKSAVDVIKVLKSSDEDNFDDGHSKFSKND